MDIRKGKVVSLDYILHDAGGKLLDKSEEGDPLVYLHGNENIIPGLERELEGRNPGDRLACVIAPADAYGLRNDELVLKVSKKDFGAGAQIEPGMQFEARGEDGAQVVTVVKVEGDEVTIDGNHPLAGETLHFQVSVVDVREATEEELAHGHVHARQGCGCECGDEGCGDECSCGEEGCGEGHCD